MEPLFYTFDELDSTSSFLKMELASGKFTDQNVVVRALRQTSGRGRFDRVWHSQDSKGLYFSILLWPLIPSDKYHFMSFAAAVATARVINNATGHKAHIKWPNDVLMNGKKIAGILLEAAGGAIIIGIGVNVNNAVHSFPEDIVKTAGSLLSESGREYDIESLMHRILKELEFYTELVRTGETDKIVEAYASCLLLMQEASVRSGSQIYEGAMQKIDQDGALLMRTADGKIKKITAGEILWQHAE